MVTGMPERATLLALYAKKEPVTLSDAWAWCAYTANETGLAPRFTSLKFPAQKAFKHPRISQLRQLAMEKDGDLPIARLGIYPRNPQNAYFDDKNGYVDFDVGCDGAIAPVYYFVLHHRIGHLSLNLMKRFAIKLDELGVLSYGYAVDRDFDLGPGAYASGFPFNQPYGSEESERLHEFGETLWNRPLKHETHLRDTYPINFVTECHLALPLGGSNLRKMIEAHSWGSLAPISETIWLWSMDGAERAAARAVLLEQHALIVTK